MILASLVRYYRRLADRGADIPALGYSSERISYALVLDASGHLVDVKSVQQPDAKGKWHPQQLTVPSLGKARASGIEPNFLWDKTSYVLGISASSKRSDKEHAAFAAHHAQALADTEDEGLLALRRFLERWDPAHFPDHPAFADCRDGIVDKNVVFQLDGLNQSYMHERPAARELWTGLRQAGEPEAANMCLVTGKTTAPSRLHPKIKGVKGAQSAGASIVSFNLDAFESYGKQQGDNAPVGEEATFAYTTALNYLLRRDDNNHQCLQLGNTTVVFWAEADNPEQAEAAEDWLSQWLTQKPSATDANQTHRLGEAMDKIRRGLPLRDLDANLDGQTRIYVLGLAPNAARIAVRFWITGSLDEFAHRLTQHYEDLRLDPPAWQTPPSVWSLILATAPRPGDKQPKIDDVSPLLEGEFMRAIFTGQHYPQSLLANLIMRFRADGKLTGLRIALVKAVLVRNARIDNPSSSQEGEPLVSLDLANTEPGYLLGRLFATLENAQYFALGNVNASIADRYYGAASATPATVFAMLLHNNRNHLAKIRKDKKWRGKAINLEKDIGQIIDSLPSEFPKHLTLEGQGRFAIGYYHQKQAYRTSKNDHSDSQGETA